jgi:hypothetical protein
MPEMEIKDKINDDKITFYILKALNAHIPKQNSYINKLNQCPGTLFNIFLENITFYIFKKLTLQVSKYFYYIYLP